MPSTIAASRAFSTGTMTALRPRAPGFERDGQHAFDGAHLAGEREFADEAILLDIGKLHFGADGDHAERDGQIEARALFFHVGGREIDRGAPARPAVAAVADGGGDAVFALLDGDIGQPDDDDDGIAPRAVDLDLYFKCVHSVNGGRVNFCQHAGKVAKSRGDGKREMTVRRRMAAKRPAEGW